MNAARKVLRCTVFGAVAGLTLATATFAQPTSTERGSEQRRDAARPAISATAKAISEAIEALNAGKYLEARRAAIAVLTLENLSPYERSEIEWMLFNIAYAQERFDEAREHFESAITAGGLDLLLLHESTRNGIGTDASSAYR